MKIGSHVGMSGKEMMLGSRQKILWLLTEQEKCDYCWM